MTSLETLEFPTYCACQSRIHALNQRSPNCLNCGKILCDKECALQCSFCMIRLPLQSPSLAADFSGEYTSVKISLPMSIDDLAKLIHDNPFCQCYRCSTFRSRCRTSSVENSENISSTLHDHVQPHPSKSSKRGTRVELCKLWAPRHETRQYISSLHQQTLPVTKPDDSSSSLPPRSILPASPTSLTPHSRSATSNIPNFPAPPDQITLVPSVKDHNACHHAKLNLANILSINPHHTPNPKSSLPSPSFHQNLESCISLDSPVNQDILQTYDNGITTVPASKSSTPGYLRLYIKRAPSSPKC